MPGSFDAKTQALLDFRAQFGALVRENITPPSRRSDPVRLWEEQRMSRITFALWKKSVEDALKQANK